MSRVHWAALAIVLMAAASAGPASDRDFDAIVRGVESHFQTRRTRIPMFGLAKFVVRVAHPEGVKQLDLAIFEDLNAPEADEFDAVVRQATGERWQPMVVVRSRRDGESTYIYSHVGGKDWNLLVASFEQGETTLVRLRVEPAVLARILADPAHAGACLRMEEDR